MVSTQPQAFGYCLCWLSAQRGSTHTKLGLTSSVLQCVDMLAHSRSFPAPSAVPYRLLVLVTKQQECNLHHGHLLALACWSLQLLAGPSHQVLLISEQAAYIITCRRFERLPHTAGACACLCGMGMVTLSQPAAHRDCLC